MSAMTASGSNRVASRTMARPSITVPTTSKLFSKDVRKDSAKIAWSSAISKRARRFSAFHLSMRQHQAFLDRLKDRVEVAAASIHKLQSSKQRRVSDLA